MLPKTKIKINDIVELINVEEMYTSYTDFKEFAEAIIGYKLEDLCSLTEYYEGTTGIIKYIGLHEDDNNKLLYIVSTKNGTIITNQYAIKKIE